MPFLSAAPVARPLRLALSGPPGCGRTFSALTLAKVFAAQHGPHARVGVVDTDQDSARLYGGLFSFDVLALDEPSAERLTEALGEAERAGIAVLVVDTITPAWAGPEGVLERHARAVEKAGSAQGVSSSPLWRSARRSFDELLSALLRSPLDVIVTARTRAAPAAPLSSLAVPEGSDGAQALAQVFDFVGVLNTDHALTFVRARGTDLDRKIVTRPDETLGLRLWAASRGLGAPRAPSLPSPSYALGFWRKRISEATTRAALDAVAAELAEVRPKLSPKVRREVDAAYRAHPCFSSVLSFAAFPSADGTTSEAS